MPLLSRERHLMSDTDPVDFDALLDRRNFKPDYQPIYDLASGKTIAVEALARWPHLGVSPDRAFRSAAYLGRLTELDDVCRTGAIDDAVAHGLPPRFGLFINLEPSVLSTDTATRLLERVAGRFQVIVEITERALLHRPAELLRTIQVLRSAGCAIALDDVGAEPASLALLPFVAPDVIKLDISLVQRWPTMSQAAILTAVASYAERTDATVLAEGVETEAHLAQALALGATLGQGWYFSRPGPLGTLTSPDRGVALRQPTSPSPATPFSLVDPASTRTGTKGLLLGISHHLENQGLALETPPVILAVFQESKHFTPATAERYLRLAVRCPLVGALGTGLPTEPVPGVRGVSLASDDLLRGEWVVAVVGTHYTGALIARDLGDSGPDRDRRFSFVLTHHHDTVLAAARSLLERVTPTQWECNDDPLGARSETHEGRSAVATEAGLTKAL
jgi:EAL domain-containing protein (putative c-di-GMP-specific phosphodiesterase class I)/DICT domain-containing protein